MLRAHGVRPAFTLVELVVVVAIILVILGLVGPALTEIWQGRKEAEAINTLQGLLMTARARSLEAEAVETGYFVFVDADGTQHLTPIEQPREVVASPDWQDVFVVADDPDWRDITVMPAAPDHTLPAPMRILPRYVVDDSRDKESYEFFSDEELVNNDYRRLPTDGDPSQRHRNFFTIIYSVDGQLQVNRDVLIVDKDAEGDGVGDRTGLPVAPLTPGMAEKYYARDGAELALYIDDPRVTALVDPEKAGVALNFPSVDGLLVYDDTLFGSGSEPAVVRQRLLETAQPLYVNRWTGVVIRGPVGEGVVTP